MRKSSLVLLLIIVCLLSFFSGCKHSVKNPPIVKERDSLFTLLDKGVTDTVIRHPRPKAHVIDSIYGDTVWVKPIGERTWKDTVTVDKDITVFVSAYIDTTDYIVDTVLSAKGGRIVMGYNHCYDLNFYKKDHKYWFSVSFNKKHDLEPLIGGTDFWLDSNLDVFKRILYDKKYDKYIVEFNINPRYNYGSVYYFVIDTTGNVDYTGTAGGWGGSDPDGAPFITQDDNFYISPFEVYSFPADTAISIADFTMLSEEKTYHHQPDEYKWLHGLRQLDDNCFLVVFGREDDAPEYNALILRTDTTLESRFRYYGILEDMDATLLFQYVPQKNSYYLYDSDQQVLITIPADSLSHVQCRSLRDFSTVNGDTMSGSKYIPLVFDDFGNYSFYLSRTDSTVFVDNRNFGP